jgi:hypothetical protein
MTVVFRVNLERETEGRWIAEVIESPGALAWVHQWYAKH